MFYHIFHSKNKILSCDSSEINPEYSLINVFLETFLSIGKKNCEESPFQAMECQYLEFNTEITQNES